LELKENDLIDLADDVLVESMFPLIGKDFICNIIGE